MNLDKIKKIFIQCLNGLNGAKFDEQIRNKKIISIIESNIISPIYEEENYEQLLYSDDEKDFEKAMTSMIVTRKWATKTLIKKLCNFKEWNGVFLNDCFNSENVIVMEDKRLFDYVTAKKLYKEILVPYYKMLGFPTRVDNNVDEPYNFNLIDFNTGFISESESLKLKKYYLEKGYSSNVIDELIMQYPDFGLTPSEVMLLEQHRKMVEESDMYVPEYKDNSVQNKNSVTNSKNDKGIKYYTCDGKEVASMDEVMAYNEMYYNSMKTDNSGKKGINR